jgi:hypothetical protein
VFVAVATQSVLSEHLAAICWCTLMVVQRRLPLKRNEMAGFIRVEHCRAGFKVTASNLELGQIHAF